MLLLGPLLARLGRAHIAPPGGDFPARRTIGTHLEALQAMGARISDGPDHVLEAPDGLKSASMYLYEASVTGTETALLAAATIEGVTEIRHAATEPHVVELCEFLQKMGAGVSGIGSPSLRIEGVRRLHGAQHQLGGDYIEAGSWAVVAAITGGEVAIEGARAGGHRGRGGGLQADADRLRHAGRHVRRPAVDAARGATHHHRTVAGVSERPGKPRHRARDAGRRAGRWCTTGCTSCGCSRSSR